MAVAIRQIHPVLKADERLVRDMRRTIVVGDTATVEQAMAA